MSAPASPVLSASQLERLGALGEERSAQVGASVPGIFAAGDVRSGSTKRCATAVGEGATAVRFVHRRLAELADARQ